VALVVQNGATSLRYQHLVLWLAIALLLTPALSAEPRPTQVTDVSWEADGLVGKVIIRLDGAFAYRTTASRSSIRIDLWRAQHTQWESLAVDHPYVRRVRVNQITSDVARLRIDLKKPARYKTFVRTDPSMLAVQIIPPWMATRRLPPSLAYEKRRVSTGAGTTAVHVLRVNPEDPDLEIRPVMASDMVIGKETTSIIATRHDAVAGINGGYFAGGGLPLGMVVIDGKLISAPLPRRSVFAISREGKPLIQPFDFQGRIVTSDNASLLISAVNRPPLAAGVAVYTPAYGPLTPPFKLAAIVRNGVVVRLTSGRILIPEDGYVLAVNESDAGLLLQHVQSGQRVWMKLDFNQDLDVISALGGGPRLVKDGVEFIPFDWEWFSDRLFQTRAPRTAIGITEAGKLLLVTVDGRSKQNTGMTLRELARLMVKLGAHQAMNFDGGGSATMVVGGRIMNDPSDGRERPVSSALIVLHRTR
jgi:hypothetical protein